jgi:polysaccharide biosynthesis/export protein
MLIRRQNWRTAALMLWLSAFIAANAFAVTDDYRLGAGDLVRISVFGAPELATEARVAQSGAITCPLIGSIAVAGLSTAEAETLLAKRYLDGGYVRKPQISLLVVEFQSQKISVLGHVNKPGQYPLRATSNVLDVLADAGGVIAQTAGDHATLMRKDGSSVEIDMQLLFQGDPVQNVPVRGGDRLVVPRAEQFYIYGQVQKPGMYRLEPNMTLSRAISASGGLTPRGTERRAIVKRRDTAGKEESYAMRTTDVVRPDDVLYIKESLF